ncbi:ATP-binding protein [Snodgrassella alvi]|uniref:ATP-binding protein n=6 Tax=Snodgrassella alvi TaxID=1196083 RepID=UPI000A04ACD8|nr:ATP-binding protein [Snodgrassella alvi]ORF13121.1 hypothetical protein BGI01_05890 [Snodgrassella alvi]
MKKKHLEFAGEIINHLSVTIPSNIFALNELTKNSYDAFATDIQIYIDQSNSQLIIKDNGIGMSEVDVNKLLRIGNSTKKYGKKNTYNNLSRYVQGSKGLGFLSSFKFGDVVHWETNKEGKKIKFDLNKKDIISKRNASSYDIFLELSNTDDIGTTITIDLDKNQLNALIDYFSDEKNITKAVNAFYDVNINLSLHISNKKFVSKSISSFLNEGKDYQFCYVTYDSSNSNIKIYRNQQQLQPEKFRISSKDYRIEVELMIYYFKQGVSKRFTNISKLFYRDYDDALTPLLYINNNLFNNYKYFDSNINRSKRSAESMPQITGYVKVYCSSSELEFNSDRTNFVENELTRNIIKDLNDLNTRIQKLASLIKEEDRKNTGEISTGTAYIKDDEENITPKIKTAKINLNVEKEKNFFLPSKQIDLKQYITSVINSSGEKIDLEALKFLIDGKESITNIIPSITEPCEKQISVQFIDNITGLVNENFKLYFKNQETKIEGTNPNQLLTFFSSESYRISIHVVASLINQVNKIYSLKEPFYETIACTLRTILELSIDSLKSKFSHIFNHEKVNNYKIDNLSWDVIQVINFIKTHNELLTKIANILGISFQSLKKSLDIDSYIRTIDKAHLGAHKSTTYLTNNDIVSLGKQVGHFAVLCDVMIKSFDKEFINLLELVEFNSNNN